MLYLKQNRRGAQCPPQTPNTMQKKSTKGADLAYDIATRLRGNEFKDMTLGEIDDFRAEMALFLDLKKEW